MLRLGMRLDSGAAGEPVWAALEDEEAGGVGVGAGLFTDGLLEPLFEGIAPDCEPGNRDLPGGDDPVLRSLGG